MKSTTMIRKLFLAVLLLSLFISCSDGDITIQSISFNEIGIDAVPKPQRPHYCLKLMTQNL